ncbi:MAG: hypothetical protein K6A45_02905 [Lachnospiraceae bacterium]|nr:hypothetical protein [Lachnospiraceae bacterium]
MINRFTYAMRKGVDESLPDLMEKFRKDNDEKEKYFDSMYIKLGEKIDGKSDEELATPDTFGCECLFLSHFYTEQMADDFSFIAREFFMNGFREVDFSKGIVQYVKGSSGGWSIKVGMYFRILNLMWNAVKQGSEYAKNFFLYLYKTYYRKEYKQLKRFRTISISEINAISAKNPEDKDVYAVARVYTMTQLMGIEINNAYDRYFKYAVLSEYYEKWSECDEEADGGAMWDGEENIDCMDDISYECEEVTERYHISSKSALAYLNKVKKYIEYVRDNDCGRAAGTIFGLPDEKNVVSDLGETLAELKELFGDGEYSDKEILLFWALDCAVSFANDGCRHSNMMIEEILHGCVIDKEYHESESSVLFNADEMRKGVFRLDQGESAAKLEKEKEALKEQKGEMSADKEKALVNEIEELRRKLHLQEGEIRGLKEDLSDMRKLKEEKERLSAENTGMRTELAALRNHVYNLTEKEGQTDTVTVDDMKAAIRDKRIIIIGGDINWVNKMRLEFPDWTFIKPANSGTMDAKIVEKADKVYFFTDTIDHGTYYRYCNVVRDCGTPFGYIHGVNISNITKQLYKELV